MKKLALVTLIGLFLLALPLGAQINLLHEFTDADGVFPRGSLIISGTTLYGMTYRGGSSDFGTIFKVQTNGNDFTLLHEFTGGLSDGYYPYGNLLLSGTTLYGTTIFGGVSDNGTIFKINTDGGGFTLLHSFAGGINDGVGPRGSLIISGTTLYGTTENGGTTTNKGTIFKMDTDGDNFTLLHKFAGGPDDGRYPYGTLIISGSILYGTTRGGGIDDRGTIFKMDTDGDNFTLLHKFSGGPDDGRSPNGDLILSGTTLYGMTTYGGNGENGAIFRVGTGGGDLTLLRKFAGGVDDGAWPYGSLLISGTTLYGMTNKGGDSNKGTTFKIGTASTGFELLHEFSGSADDGAYPYGALIISGSTLFGMTNAGGDDDNGVIFSLTLPSITVTSPNGGELWAVGSANNITWTSIGTIANVNIDYSITNGSSWLPVAAGTANDGSYGWTVPSSPSSTCRVRVSDAADNDPSDSSNAVFTITSSAEAVSMPSQPAGANLGRKATGYPFTTGGSTSNLGHSIQYKFDWDDGSDSGWLASGTTNASHSWAANGTYHVRAMARCVAHSGVESLWSNTHEIIISDSGTLGKYNSPAQQKILPEVIWAAATGGGTWMSEVQVTDISGGSQVSVSYSTATGQRGPFMLWDNGSGGALRSMKYSNILQTIDALDSGDFAYNGTVGTLMFITQNAAFVLQVTARTLNGNYSKTFPGLSMHDLNTAETGRTMIVPNLTNNSTYRSTCGMFNPTAAALTVELRLRNAVSGQIGSTITKTLSGYGFTAFSPFSDAGVAYPANSYDNVILEVQPTSGTGKVLCFGASANNATNDPAAHLAVQNGVSLDNGPSQLQVLPEAIWAAATGGGTWMSEVQIVDVTGGSIVSIAFAYGGGNRRGPFPIWTGGTAGAKVKYANILQQLETLDSGFTYNGRVGTVKFETQDGAHNIQVTARTLNGNYSKTFPGLNMVEAETADTARVMLIQNYTSNSTYRSTCGFFNPTANAVTVEFTLLNGSGAQIGTPFSKTFVGYDYQAFSPFIEAGVPYPANSYNNVILRVRPTSGTGRVVCFGASANNASNDPAAHLAVQGQ